jgi:hypothetical protein
MDCVKVAAQMNSETALQKDLTMSHLMAVDSDVMMDCVTAVQNH